jgi:hypothetical protein
MDQVTFLTLRIFIASPRTTPTTKNVKSTYISEVHTQGHDSLLQQHSAFIPDPGKQCSTEQRTGLHGMYFSTKGFQSVVLTSVPHKTSL